MKTKANNKGRRNRNHGRVRPTKRISFTTSDKIRSGIVMQVYVTCEHAEIQGAYIANIILVSNYMEAKNHATKTFKLSEWELQKKLVNYNGPPNCKYSAWALLK